MVGRRGLIARHLQRAGVVGIDEVARLVVDAAQATDPIAAVVVDKRGARLDLLRIVAEAGLQLVEQVVGLDVSAPPVPASGKTGCLRDL